MKKTLLISASCLTLIASLSARVWTSSDAQKTFEAEYISSDATTVTVLKGGKKVTFKLDLISEDDRAWVKEAALKAQAAGAEKEAAAAFADSDFGKALKKIQKLDGKKYRKHELESVPKYFILYFSASW